MCDLFIRDRMKEEDIRENIYGSRIMTEKRFQYNVNKNSIEYNEKHFAYCNGEQNKITDKLNELTEEKEICKQAYREIKEDAIRKTRENKAR